MISPGGRCSWFLASSCHPKAEAFTPVALSPASLSLDAGGYALRPDHFKTYPGRTYRHAEPVLGLGMTAFAANKREGAAASLAASTICTMLPREESPSFGRTLALVKRACCRTGPSVNRKRKAHISLGATRGRAAVPQTALLVSLPAATLPVSRLHPVFARPESAAFLQSSSLPCPAERFPQSRYSPWPGNTLAQASGDKPESASPSTVLPLKLPLRFSASSTGRTRHL